MSPEPRVAAERRPGRRRAAPDEPTLPQRPSPVDGTVDGRGRADRRAVGGAPPAPLGRAGGRRLLGRLPRRARRPLLLGPPARAVRAHRHLGVPRPRHRAGRQPPRPPGLAAGDGHRADPVRRPRRCSPLFVAAIGTLVGSQIADLLSNSEEYITDTVKTINDTFGTNLDASDHRRLQRPERRRSSSSSRTSRTTPCSLSVDRARRAAAAVLGAAVHLLPRRRRAEDAPRHLQPADARRARSGCCGRGSWPATRPAATSTRGPCWRCISAIFHWIVFQSVGTAGAGGAGPVGRHRQPVPARRRHVPRRHPARAC